MTTVVMDDGVDIQALPILAQIIEETDDRRFPVHDPKGRARVEPVVAPDFGVHSRDYLRYGLLHVDCVQLGGL